MHANIHLDTYVYALDYQLRILGGLGKSTLRLRHRVRVGLTLTRVDLLCRSKNIGLNPCEPFFGNCGAAQAKCILG